MWYFDKKNKNLPVRPVYVVWEDIETRGSGNDWSDPDDLEDWVTEKCPIFHTVGSLIHEDDNYIIVAETLGEHDCSSMTKIPKGCIKRMDFLTIERN